MMTRRLVNGVVLVALAAVLAAGCATGRSFARGEAAGQAGDWEAAVGFYRQALEDDPDRPDYKIALERAMLMASVQYSDRARQFEAAGQPEEALRAYTKAMEFEPSNRTLAAKAGELERMLRDRLEASTPRPEIEKMRQQARRSVEPVLSPTNPEPLIVNLVQTSLREILSFIGNYSGINVTFDRDFQDRSITLKLEGVSLEQALQQIMISNQLFYKVLNERTIIVAADTTQKRQQYEDQVIRTFFVSNADATEMQALLQGMLRVAGMAIQPQIVANKTANTITIRATAPVVAVAERIVEANDKPRAEVSVNVQILEVSRERAKRYGLDLGSYSAALNFSPEAAPAAEGGRAFNLNTISQGVSTADFYLSVPSAVVRFLESDSQTKVLAKPNLRGTEGQKLSLNLGEDVPVPSTTFTPLAAGGASANPLTSYGYRTIGIIVDMTPRVTYDGDIILEISIENSARGQDTNIAGQNLPSFFSRKVQTKLRLRDGESNLLAGLLREDERNSLTGFPGIMRLPIVKQLFSNNDKVIKQTDIVMLLTPRILRTHELRTSDLSPIYIGTQSNMTLGGPPAVIGGDVPPAPGAAAPEAPAPVPAPAPAGPPAGMLAPVAPVLPGGGPRPVVPPGSSPIPGLTMPPPPAAPPEPAAVVPPPTDPVVAPTPPPAAPPATPPAAAPAPATPLSQMPSGPARITLTPPSEMRLGSGPYTVPIAISSAARVSTLTISLSYNPAIIRVRSVQEGTFMSQGGVTAAFSSQVDEKSGRVDIVITRPGDQTGASTGGLLAALLIEPVAAGTGSLSLSGSASVPGGGAAPLQFSPAGVTVR
jgi:general secretion pathway protein D